jgi:hypothetical protein
MVPTPRRSSAAALAVGFVPLESDRRHCRIRLHRSRTVVISFPFRPKRPASTSGTRSSNPLSSSSESISAVNRQALPEKPAVLRRSARARGREKGPARRDPAPLCPVSLRLIGAGRYERNGERITWRNGHRDRALDTRRGALQLCIPKLRQSLPSRKRGELFPTVSGSSQEPRFQVREHAGGLAEAEVAAPSASSRRTPCVVDVGDHLSS